MPSRIGVTACGPYRLPSTCVAPLKWRVLIDEACHHIICQYLPIACRHRERAYRRASDGKYASCCYNFDKLEIICIVGVYVRCRIYKCARELAIYLSYRRFIARNDVMASSVASWRILTSVSRAGVINGQKRRRTMLLAPAALPAYSICVGRYFNLSRNSMLVGGVDGRCAERRPSSRCNNMASLCRKFYFSAE